MKKITFIFLLLATVMISCQDKNAFTVEGNFTENTFEGKTIYLQKIDSMEAQSFTVIDSCVIKNNKFKMKGALNGEAIMGFLSVGHIEAPEEESPMTTIVLEPGTIKVKFEKKDVTVEGTPKNNEFNKVLVTMNKVGTFFEELEKAGNINNMPLNAEGLDAKAQVEKLQEELLKANFDFVKANINNKAGQFLFFSSFTPSSFVQFSKEQVQEIIAAADSTVRNMPNIMTLEKEVNRVVPEVGLPFEDVQLVDMEGSRVALSKYVEGNKCTLIDFWASWCRPCIEEMPNLIKAYNTYKSKGFEIVGISVDDDRQAWHNAVSTHKMSWIQLGDDTRSASAIYAVNAIPHTILLDKDGVIVAKNLRGKELEDKIAEILK
ncbi:peroxiredoxin [Dysgonomonas hofstadii]|uniref:Peroxiredoxin n=1 Tax=Dysgonomonas hofstadii TaxID=637886 RepID=A0A840CTE3_9BACT|nr:TlpA disulfide reductase family protein [Dysgonomonas hofstadii]MBB4038281.1 peroxiredoxin [Dysgonomonas hofstadii]